MALGDPPRSRPGDRGAGRGLREVGGQRCGESTRPKALDAAPVSPADSFLGAVGRAVPEGIGSVPGVRLTVRLEEAAGEMDKLWPLLAERRGAVQRPASSWTGGGPGRPSRSAGR